MKGYIQPEIFITVVEDADLLTMSVSAKKPGLGDDDMTSPF